ncbi:armadillo-type protein [Phlyctochytrium arcticum]|nr:armadillo-type protein [Phlyctochytrium arcticum]
MPSGAVMDGITDENGSAKVEVLPIVKKLGSMSVDDRAWAATALSNLVLERDTRKQLLAGGLVDALLKLLTDTNMEVALEAAGALRNLAVAGGDDVCREIFRKNALIPLVDLVPKIFDLISQKLSNAPLPADADKSAALYRHLSLDFAEQVVALLWSLSETLDDAVQIITDSNVIPYLVQTLDPTHAALPWKLIQICAQTLNTLTDDNEGSHKYFLPSTINHLLTLASGRSEKFSTWTDNHILLRPLAANILYNLRSLAEPADQPHLYSTLFSAIESLLDYDFPAASTRALEIAAALENMNVPEVKQGDKPVEIQDLADGPSRRLEELEAHLSSIQLGLEVLANSCAEDVAEDEWLDEDNGAGDDEDADNSDDEVMAMMEEDMQVINDTPAATTEMDSDATAPNESSTIIDPRTRLLLTTSSSLFSKLLTLATSPPPTSTFTAHQDLINYAANLETLHLRVFDSLSNTISLIGAPYITANPSSTIPTFTALFNVCEAVASDPDRLDSALGVLFAWTHSAHTAKHPIRASDAQIETLCSTLTSSIPVPPKCKIVSTLSLLALPQSQIPTNQKIGSTLISILPAAPPLLISEILNAFFDIYADCAFDYDLPVYVQGGFNAVLKELVPVLKARIKGVDRRTEREVRVRGDEAMSNLVAFVKYKNGERKG